MLHRVESKDLYTYVGWDRGGMVVVHQTPNREVMSSIRTGDTMYSVSPRPKKGHGKIAKKGHFLTRGSMSKRALSARHGKQKGTFKWLMAC